MLRFSRRLGRRSLVFGLGLFGLLGGQFAAAGDNTWTGAATMVWDTTASNWTTPLVWNNANGDGAIFGGNALGAISVPGSINVNSLDFQVTGYSLTGAGSLNFVNGTSTQTTGVINVAGGTTTIGVPINSSVTAVQKIGAGVLELSQPVNITASFPLAGPLSANLLIGPAPFGQSPVGGTVRVLNSTVLPSTISVGLGGGGILDIGANNVTIGQLTFTNQNQGIDYPNYGVIGTGTLRVTGEINVVGQGSFNFGNAISTPLNLGGGTQIVRSAAVTFFSGPGNLMFFGPLSNGSLLKVPGYRDTGIIGGVDGIALLANNTYAGSTVINGGTLGSSLATGTNASTSLQVYQAAFSVQGVDGSYGSAGTIQIFAGGALSLDNNASFGGGAGIPSFPAANNGNRISDTAAVTMRDGTFVYRGLSTAASSETFGSLNLTGGNNVVTLAPTGAGGTASLTATGNLTMDPRSTMQISASSAVLGTTGFLKFGGTVPAAVGGIIPRIASTSDLVFYDSTNGFTPLPAASYSPTLVAGANVALSAATAVPASVAINALKTTAAVATTIDPAATLTVGTGMMLAASGTHTINGGTLAFGGSPGTFFGTHTISSAITGTQGVLAASGTLTLSGDLTGLTGTLSNIGTGTLTLSGTAANYPGAIENRRSFLNINSNSTGGAITLGVAANDFNLLGTVPTLSISGAGANAVINRNIVVDNGGNNAAGLSLLRSSFQPIISPLSNSTGSQTIAGNITLNTSVSLQGGGGSGTGATIFSGNIAGPGTFVLANGRANFTGDISNAGGLIVSQGGFTGIANFQGTISGGVPIVMNAGSTNTSGISYSTQANLGSSTITVQNSSGPTAPSIFALQTGSINNSITLNGDVTGNAATGVTATWTGPMTGTGGIYKNGAGTLVLPNAKAYSGNTTVSAGTLQLSGAGSFANSPTVTVASTAASSAGVILDVSGVSSGANFDSSTFAGGSFTLATGQTLKGFGTVSGKTVVKSGTGVGPGASASPNLIGTLTFDNSVFLGGSYEVNVASTGAQRGDQIVLSNGGMTIDPSASLIFPASNTYDNSTVMPLITVNGGGLLSGTFVGAVAPSGYNLVYTSTSLLLTPVPEPGTLLLAGMAAAGGFGVWRRKRAGRKVAE